MNKETENKKASSDFLKADRGKTKSNAIEIPSIALPKGGGAIKGIDEKFSVNAVNGTASFSIPLPFSTARGASPSISLSYSSGAGNGIFGLGWDLSLPSIKRKTDKELPKYLDSIDSDGYLFSEAEDLIAAFEKKSDGSFRKDGNGNYVILEKKSQDDLHWIRYYKPRIEGLFARIERWTEIANGTIKWRVINKENVTTLFGWTSASRIADPADKTKKIFKWLPEFLFDDKGNCCHYIYKEEDSTGFKSSLLHNRNRLKNGNITYTNLYLEKIRYGNKTPYLKFNAPFPDESDYFFQTVFDYGEYNLSAPYEKIKSWDYREDAFSEYKSGFEIRTSRLCKRVLLFHFFNELPGGTALIKSLNFEYDVSAHGDFTFLKSIASFGYIKNLDGEYTSKNLPAMEFEYQQHDWNHEVKIISSEDLVHAPIGLDEQHYHFTDLFNEGLSGILTEQANAWFYKHNLGKGKFETAQPVLFKPSFTGLGSKLQLTDLDADGTKQLVNFSIDSQGYFELSDEEDWQPYRNFDSFPNININDPNTRLLDLNGDGRPDILITEDNVFTWYGSEGRRGFGEIHKAAKSFNEEAGPHIIFSESRQTIFLADMSGDGLSDIVRIQNKDVCYWPNLGYGKFGTKVVMDNSPVFDHPDSFNPEYLRLVDIDGSGTTDIIYLGTNKFRCWINLSGNSFSAVPFEIDSFPEIHNHARISVADLLGNGVSCIVWSSNLSKDEKSPLKYIDLMNSKKPHLMINYKNNLGKEVGIEYTPSTEFYINDKLAGRPWVTKLHFPVHCISKTITTDKISGSRFVSSYIYHHGYYDHAEREFRGFGMVEQIDAEHFDHWIKGNAGNIVVDRELHQEPVITKKWFHTGAFLNKDKILTQFSHEYWHEEMARQGFPVVSIEEHLADATLIAAPGLVPSIIDSLSPEEWREALRACKGMALRTEVFASDAPLVGAATDQIKKGLTPYTVASQGYMLELVQPRGQNRHAIFVVKEREDITYVYERDTMDPRIAHNLNIKLDEYNNVLESASVVYPRKNLDNSLPEQTKDAQNKTLIIFSESRFTDDINDDDHYRLRVSSEVKTYELKGVDKAGPYYTVDNFKDILVGADVAEYHEIDKIPSPGIPQKRLIEHIRNLYYKNDLTGALDLHFQGTRGLVFENYQLAYTPLLMNDIFGSKVDAGMMITGKFTNIVGDANWWTPSGSIRYIEGFETAIDAGNRFYMPIAYTDPYGAKTKVKYYGSYFQFIEEMEDALLNRTKADLINFRTLTVQRVMDQNDNITEAITDELGQLKAMAVFGKGNEADDLTGLTEQTLAIEQSTVDAFFASPLSTDLTSQGKALLRHATIRYVYDFHSYVTSGKPVAVATIAREEHYQKNNDSPVQLTFEYSNGQGQVVMKKSQASPGMAKQLVVAVDGTYTVIDTDTSLSDPQQLRWIGNGRIVHNNKGNAVKQYEPYFSVSHRYEDVKELVETGVTPVLYYDATDRLVKTEFPDGTMSRTEFYSWKQVTFDANDTVLDTPWYSNRTNRLIDAELIAAGKDPAYEKSAADKTAKHSATPKVEHIDTLGRPVLLVEHNKNIATDADEYIHTRILLDIEGNLNAIIDERGNEVMRHRYDMLGNKVYQKSMDSGKRWLLINILGNPLRTWDERNHEFLYSYDILHRPLQNKIMGGDGVTPLNNIFDRIFYGEGVSINGKTDKELNLRGQIYRHFDTGGLLESPEYDFYSQSKSTTRKIFSRYKETVNWDYANLNTTDIDLIPDLESDKFAFILETDALKRITRQTAPDGSVIASSYNRAGLLDSETVAHVDPAITTVYIKHIDYNEKNKRIKILYGNEVVTRFYYDRDTFRLNRLESKRTNGDPLQDWHYTYDPVGNITHIEDKNVPIAFFDNNKTTGLSTYAYDAMYRLVEANGRENNIALTYNNQDNWDDASFMRQLSPGNPLVVRNYTQTYEYDKVGNITQMKHLANGGSWTRNYEYETANNRLKNTKVGQGVISYTYNYQYHPAHGCMTAMPHLEEMGWNFKEELIKTIRQRRIDGGTPETTYYQYDGQGRRLRKVTENTAAPGMTPVKKEERVYIAGYELYKKHSSPNIGLERSSLSLMEEQHRFAIIETRNDIDDDTEKHLVRYQLHNHLGTACLELDGSNIAAVINYEEYHPYGTTAYQAKNSTIKSAAKRYRYTGMERDEESGLNYHSARYYMVWLGRWCNTDPGGLVDGINLYRFARNNPVINTDSSGMTPPGRERIRFMSGIGFDYDRRQDIWYSRRDCIQRNFGYFDIYDTAAALAIDIDNETIRFDYGGRSWKIELWKGDYNTTLVRSNYAFGTGAEIGVYVDPVLPGAPRDTACAINDQLEMRFELYNRADMVHPIFTRDSRNPSTGDRTHWWLTGFTTNRSDAPPDLVMRATIGFVNRAGVADPAMAMAFYTALTAGGRYSGATIRGNEVSFTFDRPTTPQPPRIRRSINRYLDPYIRRINPYVGPAETLVEPYVERGLRWLNPVLLPALENANRSMNNTLQEIDRVRRRVEQ